MERIVINPYDIGQLDSKVTPIGNRIDLYFDNVKSDFTAMVYHDTKNRSHVYYSKCQARHYSEEVAKKFTDYHDTLDAMFSECIQNPIGMYLDDGELYKTIVEVEYIPELRGLNFKTAGYIIGSTCMRARFSSNKADEVQYIIRNSSYIINGETLDKIAYRYLLKDISDSCSFGYLYYNKSRSIVDAQGNEVKVAQDNDRRFGQKNNIKGVSSLMRNFTSFVPIGFKWSMYTPIWLQNEEFISRLKNETVLGLDWVEVPNLTYDGNNINDFDTVTFYTTKKRIHQVLGEDFNSYNFRFFNELIAGLFLDGLGYTSAKYAAVNNNNQKKFISPLEYMSLVEDEQCIYKVTDGNSNVAATALASKLVKRYWATMNPSKHEISKNLIEKVQGLTMESIYSNNAEKRARSNMQFQYVV